jgi:hypothetical protein
MSSAVAASGAGLIGRTNGMSFGAVTADQRIRQ